MDSITEEDKAKIDAYRAALGKYPKPSVTADIIAVRPADAALNDDSGRENPNPALEILLVRRGQWPHEGTWALPGGFIRPTESVEEGVRRELHEETTLESKAHPLIPVGVFSKPGRDMRAWIISNAFLTVYRRGEGLRVKGADDAAEAKWFRIEGPTFQDDRFKLSFSEDGSNVFTLRGTFVREDLQGGRILSIEENPLAFDHAEIIATAFLFRPGKGALMDYIRKLTETGNGSTPSIELNEQGVPVDPQSLIGREFEHFKGKRYRLEEFAIDSETLEPMVVYRQLYGEHRLWVRPAKMFFETVSRDGYNGPRFRLLEASK